jgi:hypothetical protein
MAEVGCQLSISYNISRYYTVKEKHFVTSMKALFRDKSVLNKGVRLTPILGLCISICDWQFGTIHPHYKIMIFIRHASGRSQPDTMLH